MGREAEQIEGTGVIVDEVTGKAEGGDVMKMATWFMEETETM